ncbi:MAG: LPS-assembly protein LptD [Epsilonproteobacteria bacterium]|nr:LPS-assembly protein LptD [Campylobacterota bacterium]
MRKLLLILLILTVSIFSKEMIEVYAKKVSAKGKSFVAEDSVVILYDNAMIKADRATYDKNTSLLTLEGKVEMISSDNDVLASDKLVINTTDKSVKIQKIFIGGEENLWMDASGADKLNEKYVIHNSKISSCDVSNPDWTIEFERADYYRDKNFVTMKDAKVRFYDTTIFYLPYLAFPTLTKRTTGLLYPRFQLSKREGFLYEQPFFYVPSENWDVEIDPQIRTNRGFGSYVTTRFVDSNHSDGYFRTGYFRNFDSYADSNNLNKEHLGAELFYQSKDILSNSDYSSKYKSGFYFNGTYLNDREYLNLQKSSVSALVSSNLIESRLNSFVYNTEDYYALYGRYNIDISQENNDRTIQNFPSFQYHHYMDRVMKSKVFYTVDVKLDNYTRVKGSQASQAQVDLPITYYDSFFDDYLNFSMSENLYLSRVKFRNLEVDDDKSYYYYRNYHTIEFSTDLTKQYKNSWHTIHPSITYILPSVEKESSVGYDDLSDEKKELFVTETQEEQLSFALSQYYRNTLSDMKFFHTMGYSHYPNRIESKGDLINEIGYSDSNLNLYNNLKYAWNEQEIHSITSRIGYNQSNYDIMLTHFYNNDFLFNDKKTSFIQAEFNLHYQDKNSWFAKVDYDLKQGYNHEWEVGLRHKQKCWSGVVSVGQEVVPNVDNSFRNTALYFELNLNPIGGIQQSIEDDFSSQGANN